MKDVIIWILWITLIFLIGAFAFFKVRSIVKLRHPSDYALNCRLHPYTFLYRVGTPAEVISHLHVRNVDDLLDYRFDEEAMEITFTKELNSCRFVLSFQPCDDFWILKLTCPDLCLEKPFFTKRILF